MSRKSRLIVEVGCGESPWLLKRSRCLSNPARAMPNLTPLMEEYANPRNGDRFICLDIDPSRVREAIKKTRRFADLKGARISFQVGDGMKLPFKNGEVDAVILANILSAPEPGTAPVSEPYPEELCIDTNDKWRMIQEALRVLRNDGLLIIDICQTPCYATRAMRQIEEKLVSAGRIRLVTQCGWFVGGSDDWHLYHAAFQKSGKAVIKPLIIVPWTKEQKEYIRQYAASWTMY